MKKLCSLFILLYSIGIHSQTMYVRPAIGTQSTYAVTNIQKLTFSSGNLVVTKTTGSSDTFQLAGSRYVNFTDFSLGTATNELVKNNFCVYPNPVKTFLNITNQDPNQTIEHFAIISLEGRLLIEQNLINSSATNVLVADLPVGVYFCKITSNNKSQTIKFLKQ